MSTNKDGSAAGRKPIAIAARISIIYLVLGALWILFSDKLLALTSDMTTAMLLSNVKGWLYVLVTAVLLYFLVLSSARRMREHQDQLEDMVRLRTMELEKMRGEALARNRNMRTILDSTNDIIFLIDKTGTFTEVNSAAAAEMGTTADMAVGRNIRDLLPNLMNDQRWHMIWDMFRSDKPENCVGLQDGKWYVTWFYPIHEADGSVGAVASFSRDISVQKKAEAENFMSQQMLREIIDNAPVGIYWRNRENKLIGFNKVTVEIAGLSAEEASEGMGDTIRPVSLETGLPDDNMRILESGVAKLHYEAEMINAKGESRIVRLSKVPLKDQAGNPNILLCVMEDISEQKQMIQDLISARHEATQASMAKSEFLSRMSHEIRSPLNAIIGITHIARRAENAALLPDYLDKIDISSRLLLTIVNDILDISRIEAGKMVIQHIAYEFDTMVEEAVAIVLPKTEEKRQSLDVLIDRNLPRRAFGDPVRLKQVIINLLTNASKFTPGNGRIWLHAGIAEVSGKAHLKLSVGDNGIGIPPEQAARLFMPFEQLNMVKYRESSGTGLGLAITKNIVELMGGEISLKSAVGEGSEFTILLPLEAAPSQAATDVKFTDWKVLVVDDEPDTCQYMADMFKDLAIACDVTTDSGEAVRRVSGAKAAGMPYNLAFIDWRMPGMNGIETANAIRKACDGAIHVIMISKYDLDDVLEQMEAAGIRYFLAKPIFPSRLCGILNEIAHTTHPQASEAGFTHTGVFRGKRILVAEDMEINRLIIREMLRETGAEILEAADGNEAVAMYAAESGRIDAILMDLQMPGLDGLEATRAIRCGDTPHADTVAIIAMTAHVYREDVEQARLAGMNDHIGKPIEFSVLLDKLSLYLKSPEV